MRPGIKPACSWILVGFVSIVPQREPPSATLNLQTAWYLPAPHPAHTSGLLLPMSPNCIQEAWFKSGLQRDAFLRPLSLIPATCPSLAGPCPFCECPAFLASREPLHSASALRCPRAQPCPRKGSVNICGLINRLIGVVKTGSLGQRCSVPLTLGPRGGVRDWRHAGGDSRPSR